jgi:hypothetical protein
MATTRYGIHGASLNGGSLLLTQVNSYSFDPGQSIDEIVPGGVLDRGAVILGSASSMVRIRSRDVATIFGAVSPSVGYYCSGSSVFDLQQRASGGTYTGSTGANAKITVPVGFLVPESISASAGGNQEAQVELTLHALYDGTNAPMSIANSANLAGSVAFNSAFYLGPLYINSVKMEGIISSSVEFGLQFSKAIPDGSLYPTVGSIVERKPRFSFTMLRVDFIASNITNFFNAAAAGTVAAYFYKGATGTGRVAAATTSHAKFSATASTISPDTLSVRDNDDATVTVTIRPTSTVAVSVASAVP